MVRIFPYLDYHGDTSGCTKPELCVYVLPDPGAYQAPPNVEIENTEKAVATKPLRVPRPSPQEQRRLWREQSAQRRKG